MISWEAKPPGESVLISRGGRPNAATENAAIASSARFSPSAKAFTLNCQESYMPPITAIHATAFSYTTSTSNTPGSFPGLAFSPIAR